MTSHLNREIRRRREEDQRLSADYADWQATTDLSPQRHRGHRAVFGRKRINSRRDAGGRSTRHPKDSHHWCEKSVKKSAKYQGFILRAGEPRQSRHQPACPRHSQGEVFPLSTPSTE